MIGSGFYRLRCFRSVQDLTKSVKILPLIILFLLLSSCGGGGDSAGLDSNILFTRIPFPCDRVDFDNDEEIDFDDIVLFKAKMCGKAGDELFEDKYDIDRDGMINIQDSYFLKCCYGMKSREFVDLKTCGRNSKNENMPSCNN